MEKLNAENLYLIAMAGLEAALGKDDPALAETACQTILDTSATLKGDAMMDQLQDQVTNILADRVSRTMWDGDGLDTLSVCRDMLDTEFLGGVLDEALAFCKCDDQAAWLKANAANALAECRSGFRLSFGSALIAACKRLRDYDTMDAIREALLAEVE